MGVHATKEAWRVHATKGAGGSWAWGGGGGVHATKEAWGFMPLRGRGGSCQQGGMGVHATKGGMGVHATKEAWGFMPLRRYGGSCHYHVQTSGPSAFHQERGILYYCTCMQ